MDADQEDAARLRRGDTAGLGGLMGRHQDRLYRYLHRLLGDEAVADDVFQQTWLKVTERIGRYDASRPFLPWLLTVARNLAFDHLRRYEPESLDESEAPATPAREAGESSPFVQLAARERRERVAAALGELKAPDRDLLALRFTEELSLPDLAAALAVPLPTAKARLYRALARLRTHLLARGAQEDWT